MFLAHSESEHILVHSQYENVSRSFFYEYTWSFFKNKRYKRMNEKNFFIIMLLPLCSLVHIAFGYFVDYQKSHDFYGIDGWIEKCNEIDEKERKSCQ